MIQSLTMLKASVSLLAQGVGGHKATIED